MFYSPDSLLEMSSPYILRRALLGLVLTLLTFSVSAQTINSAAWVRLPGQAIEIAASEQGEAAAIDSSNNVWRWDKKSEKWRSLPGKFSHIDITDNGQLWGVSIDGQVLNYQNRQWTSIGTGASNLTLGRNNDLVVATNTGSLARYLINERRWEAIDGSAKDLEVAKDGWIWTISNKGIISRQLGDRWIGLPGRAKDISIDESGRILIVTPSGKLKQWDPQINDWITIKLPFSAQTIESSSSNTLWATNQQGIIFVKGLALGEEAIKPKEPANKRSTGNPSQTVDDSEYKFSLVQGTGLDLSIGLDGSIFSLQSAGQLGRWSNTDSKFNDFPGDLDQIELDWNGRPWGVGRGGALYRHDGEAWRDIKINLDIEDISIGADKRVLVLGKNRNVYELTPPYTSYTRLRGSGVQIATVPDKKSYWLLDNRARIFQCTHKKGCSRMPLSAIDIEVGPGGTVLIVDSKNILRRFNPSNNNFDIVKAQGIPLNGKYGRVAIGPNDRPWVVDTLGKIYASDFFNRDESQDKSLAHLTRRTEKVTNGDGGSGIVILSSIKFTSSVVPTSATGFPNLGHGLMDLTSGYQDVLLTTGFSSNCTPGTGRSWVYDADSRDFNFIAELENANFPVIINAEFNTLADDVPALAAPLRAIYGIFPQNCKNYQLIEFDFNVFTAGNFAIQDFDAAVLIDFFKGTQNLETDLDTSEDGWIVWTDRQGDMGFHHPISRGFFTLKDNGLTFKRIAIGADLDTVWAVDTNNNVYQLIDATSVQQQKLSSRAPLYIGNGNTARQYIAVLRSNLSSDRALDVGVGFDNTVWTVDLDGRLKKWDPSNEIFTAYNKDGITRVAVNAKGKPIVANFPSSRRVYFGR